MQNPKMTGICCQSYSGTRRDDEAMVLRALARALEREYEVTSLSSPQKALRCITSGEAWDVILCDMLMPGMNGVEFARRALEICPALAGRIVLMTGGTFTPKASSALEKSGLPVITKPFDLDALRALLVKLGSGQQ
jgi:CheY-like chemotaxis protein